MARKTTRAGTDLIEPAAMRATSPIKLALAGATGRMGRLLIRACQACDAVELVAAIAHPASSQLQRDAGEIAGLAPLGLPISTDTGGRPFDVLVDFSAPAGVATHLHLCQAHQAAFVLGTTGYDTATAQQLRAAAQHLPLLVAANTSVGINLCLALVEMASRVLGGICDIEIVEAHHRDKTDAPSGTALLLGEHAARATHRNFPACGVFTRHGATGARPADSIGFSTIRGGDLAGEHTVLFIGDGERVEITHRATDRAIFARGALQAACWLVGQPSGFYSMREALALAV